MKETKNWKILIYSVIGLVAVCVIAVLFNVFKISELPSSFIGAALGAAFTAVITAFLLNGQAGAEEVKERNVKVFEKKSEVVENYINIMWKIWEDQSVTPEEYQQLTSSFYLKVMPYLKETSRDEIGKNLIEIGKCINSDPFNYEAIPKNIFGIVNTLSDELNLGGKIDSRIHANIEKQMYPVLFKKALLDELNAVLAKPRMGETESPLMNGTYEILEDGGLYISFWFKKHGGCRIVIGSLNQYGQNGGVEIWFGLYIEEWADKLNDFRANKNKNHFNRHFIQLKRSDGKEAQLQERLPDDGYENESSSAVITKIQFDVEETLNDYRGTWKSVAKTIAKRAGYYYREIKLEGVSIPDFLKKKLE
jgi:hypothetical protein